MEIFEHLSLGFSVAFTMQNLLYAFVGCFLGTLIGVLPGVGPVAVRVDASQSHAGLAFSNCQMMAGIEVGETNRGPVKFSNCGFWGIPATDHHAQIAGSGTVIFTSCHFQGWARKNPDAPCIVAREGRLIVNGCAFLDENKRHILLESGVRSASIFGNQFTGGAKIENQSPGHVEMGLNIE